MSYMDMRSLYRVSLPTERDRNSDAKQYEDWVKKNESCLNINFSLLAEKIYEFEARLTVLGELLESLGTQNN